MDKLFERLNLYDKKYSSIWETNNIKMFYRDDNNKERVILLSEEEFEPHVTVSK